MWIEKNAVKEPWNSWYSVLLRCIPQLLEGLGKVRELGELGAINYSFGMADVYYVLNIFWVVLVSPAINPLVGWGLIAGATNTYPTQFQHLN